MRTQIKAGRLQKHRKCVESLGAACVIQPSLAQGAISISWGSMRNVARTDNPPSGGIPRNALYSAAGRGRNTPYCGACRPWSRAFRAQFGLVRLLPPWRKRSRWPRRRRRAFSVAAASRSLWRRVVSAPHCEMPRQVAHSSPRTPSSHVATRARAGRDRAAWYYAPRHGSK